MPESREMCYDQRLRDLKIYSMKGKRDRGDLIFQWVDDINIFELAPYKSTRNQGNR